MKQNGELLKQLRYFEEQGIPSIDCVVYHKGECVFRHQSGFSDEAHTRPINGSERYNIYSCSKLITCVAVLQLIEKDIMRQDDPVYEFLPEFRHIMKLIDGQLMEVKNTMTIRHLLTMTAGFTYNNTTDNIRRGQEETHGVMETREAMKYLARDPLISEPGEVWNYSLCHDVLAAVVEEASGQRFGLYVKENIFDRVGMKRSTFLLPENELSEISAQYVYDTQTKTYNPCGPQIWKSKLGSGYESGGAGCISCVDDYIAFLEALRSGETLLRRNTVAQMTQPQISRNAEKALWIPKSYTYGLGVRCPKPGSDVQDYGWGGAAGAYAAILPDAEASLFYVQHVRNSPVQQLRPLLPQYLLKDL